MVRWLQQSNPDCRTYKAFTTIEGIFSTASFCGVVAISVDRFLAIHLHLRYQEIVTHKRIVAVVISVSAFKAHSLILLFSLPQAVAVCDHE